MFTSLTEILHIALPDEQLKLLEDYESAKLQNYLGDILLDIGKHSQITGKSNISIPFDKNRIKGGKADKCECNMKDF